jgi:hypothetical protein
MPGAPSHGQNRGLAVGAADQASRACDSAHGLTGKERAISRFGGSGIESHQRTGPHNGTALGAIHSVRAVCLPASEGGGTESSNPASSSGESATNLVAAGSVARGWDSELESALLQQPVCLSSEP